MVSPVQVHVSGHDYGSVSEVSSFSSISLQLSAIFWTLVLLAVLPPLYRVQVVMLEATRLPMGSLTFVSLQLIPEYCATSIAC